MNEDFYITLLYRKLSDEIAKDELEQLENWISKSETNRKTAERIELAWNASANLQPKFTIDLDEEFSALEKRIQADSTDREAPKTKVRQLNRTWMTLAASLVLLLTIGYLMKDQLFTPQVEWVELSTTTESQQIELADGTSVHLNKNSYLKYPKAFTDKNRQVFMKGEAFFDVKRNPEKPFLVDAEQIKVRVLGTSFNVRDVQGQKQAKVHVTSGKVAFSAKDHDKKLILEKGSLGVYNRGDQTMVKLMESSENEIAWLTKKLVFKDTPLLEVIQKLEDVYDVSIELENTDLNPCGFTSQLESKDIKAVLEELTIVFGMELERLDTNKFRLKGGICE